MPYRYRSGHTATPGKTKARATGCRIDCTLRLGSGHSRKTRGFLTKMPGPCRVPPTDQPVDGDNANRRPNLSGKTRQTRPTLSLSGETADLRKRQPSPLKRWPSVCQRSMAR